MVPGRHRRSAGQRDRGRIAAGYQAMTHEEREELEALRRLGAVGEREFRVKHDADRDIGGLEAEPLRLWHYVTGNGWFATGRKARHYDEARKPQRY